MCSLCAVTVGYVVDGTFVILLKDIDIKNVLTDNFLIGNGGDDIFTITEEDNDIVDIRTAGYELIFLQGRSDKSFFTVDIELFVGFHYLSGFDGVEVAQLCATGEVFAIFLFQHPVPLDGIFHDIGQVVVDLGNIFVHAGNRLFGLVGVELQDTPHLDLHQAEDIVLCHFAYEL